MQELGQRLREVRAGRRGSLEAVSRAAQISPAYLHKLEAGLVKSPSPHVIRRLAAALEVPYPALMELAGYIDRGESTMASSGAPSAPASSGAPSAPASSGAPSAPASSGAPSAPASSGAPTNAEIVRLLEALTREVAEIRQTQDELLRKVGAASRR